MYVSYCTMPNKMEKLCHWNILFFSDCVMGNYIMIFKLFFFAVEESAAEYLMTGNSDYSNKGNSYYVTYWTE